MAERSGAERQQGGGRSNGEAAGVSADAPQREHAAHQGILGSLGEGAPAGLDPAPREGCRPQSAGQESRGVAGGTIVSDRLGQARGKTGERGPPPATSILQGGPRTASDQQRGVTERGVWVGGVDRQLRKQPRGVCPCLTRDALGEGILCVDPSMERCEVDEPNCHDVRRRPRSAFAGCVAGQPCNEPLGRGGRVGLCKQGDGTQSVVLGKCRPPWLAAAATEGVRAEAALHRAAVQLWCQETENPARDACQRLLFQGRRHQDSRDSFNE